jgi:hypothetical protein
MQDTFCEVQDEWRLPAADAVRRRLALCNHEADSLRKLLRLIIRQQRLAARLGAELNTTEGVYHHAPV